MLDEGIALMKYSITVSAFLALLNIGMLLSQVNTQITFSGYDSVTVGTVKFGHIFCVLL